MVATKKDRCPQKRTDVHKKGQDKPVRTGRGARKKGKEVKEKILEYFYENPQKGDSIRKIAKSIGVSKSSVQKHLSIMIKKGLLREGDFLFKIKKINHYTEKIVFSGLVDFLINEMNPSCIILFGSIRKGDSVKESDIDLFVESSVKKDLDLTNFEKRLGHRIQLFVEPKIDELNKNLFNNVVNGIKLYGGFRIK